MDDVRFDHLVRSLAGAASRRGALRLLGSTVFASLVGLAGWEEAAATCLAIREACTKNRQCCSRDCWKRPGKRRGRCLCSDPGARCHHRADCCADMACKRGRCCSRNGQRCAANIPCCPGTICGDNERCCLGHGRACGSDGECCSGVCCGDVCCDDAATCEAGSCKCGALTFACGPTACCTGGESCCGDRACCSQDEVCFNGRCITHSCTNKGEKACVNPKDGSVWCCPGCAQCCPRALGNGGACCEPESCGTTCHPDGGCVGGSASCPCKVIF